MKRVKVADYDALGDRKPAHALIEGVDLVIVRWDDQISVLYGRCQHRGVLMADGYVQGNNLLCGVHSWDYRLDSGVSAYNNSESLHKFQSWVEDGDVYVDAEAIEQWRQDHPQPYNREAYQGAYQDIHGTPDEPDTQYIHRLAQGIDAVGEHGPVEAMGVPIPELPKWDDIQFVTGQLAHPPLLAEVAVGTEVVIGPRAKKPVQINIPLLVSDMSFGALSPEAKVALAMGSEKAGTAICSGEGGMLPEEQEQNSHYFYELGSGKFGFEFEKLKQVQAFHFKAGQGAKTGTGGHLPAKKVTEKIAQVRQMDPGEDSISPAWFPDLNSIEDFRNFAAKVREITGGIPIGMKLSAQHIEADLEAALQIGVDYIILDGRGGGTGAAPLLFRDHISVPTIPALARARRYLDSQGAKDVTLIITGGLRTPADFAKALALGADAVAIANAAIQAIGCLGMRACHTNNCPVGIATQKPHLRERLIQEEASNRLHRFFDASVHLMQVMARACGHEHLNQFTREDLTTWKSEMASLAGIPYGGVN